MMKMMKKAIIGKSILKEKTKKQKNRKIIYFQIFLATWKRIQWLVF